MAIITPALGAARSSLNKRFPNRDKRTDGWIGDEAHRGTRSGHNPDETGNAEYEDSDDIDEVRAVDLDKDLRHSVLNMHDVVQAILANPTDRNRCSYLIYDELIWSRSDGYISRRYTGSNNHKSHLHISGRPVNDNDDQPWLSIENLGDEVSAEEVWQTDGLIEVPTLTATGGKRPQADIDKNPHWWGATYLPTLYNNIARSRKDIRENTKLLKSIAATQQGANFNELATLIEQKADEDAERDAAMLTAIAAYQSGQETAELALQRIGEILVQSTN